MAPEDRRLGGAPLELTWDQIDAMPRRSIFVTMECAGNGRSFLRKHVEGVQWTAGAVGHAEWSGVSLRSVVERAGLNRDVTELVFYGADAGAEHGADKPEPFARSLPLEKALHPDTLLATRMNGELLEPSHGYPLRLVVPGWYGVASVKWVAQIEAATKPFLGYFQTEKYTIKHRTGGGTKTEIVGPMPVKSEILGPVEGDVLGLGGNRIFGMAWAGEEAVAGVEVSVDGGVTLAAGRVAGSSRSLFVDSLGISLGSGCAGRLFNYVPGDLGVTAKFSPWITTRFVAVIS